MREYKRDQFIITVQPMDKDIATGHLKDFKWVRIYANVNTVEYLMEGRLLLSCESGAAPASELLKMARVKAVEKMKDYKERAKRILSVEL